MVLLCIAALLIILWLVLGNGKKNVPAPAPLQSAPARAPIDTLMARGALALSEKTVPSRAAKKPRPHGPIKTKADTALSGATSPMAPESTMADTEETIIDACESDTLPPWVYTDPSGGLHHKALSVKLFATKPCAIQWKTDSAAAWKDYAGEEILIGVTTRLWLFAKDSCGNEMVPREEVYEITPEETHRLCPENMEHIKIGSAAASFCMDKYEWPNKKGALPRSYVSVYQAMDTCAAAGKRLCTADEWTIACTGPYGWKYPYGASYELYACVTNDTTARKSGSKSECRGYFDVYDMSGNLAEWTSTRSNKNRQFYDVMGGFWESGQQSGCYDVRYSYFPQNRHNPVGFRCCKDAAPQ
jgi:hypothetical protein